MLQDGTGAPRPFRYKVTCQGKGTCFEPKPLAPSADLMDLRGSMFGAYYLRNFDKLPASSMCRTLWEVPFSGLQCVHSVWLPAVQG